MTYEDALTLLESSAGTRAPGLLARLKAANTPPELARVMETSMVPLAVQLGVIGHCLPELATDPQIAVLDATHAARLAQPSGAVEAYETGAPLLALLKVGDLLPGTAIRMPLASFKNLTDNTWKQPRVNAPLLTVVFDQNAEFTPKNKTARGPERAQTYMGETEEAGAIVFAKSSAGRWEAAAFIRRENDSLGEALSAAVADLWPGVTLYQVKDARKASGPWSLGVDTWDYDSYGRIELRLDAANAGIHRGLAPNDAVLVTDLLGAGRGVGRVHHVFIEDGTTVVVLDRFGRCP